jgi:hypothetical protein
MDNWNQDKIQFPRLLAEIFAVVEFTPEQKKALCESMDLHWDDIVSHLVRAELAYTAIKSTLP